MFARRSTFLFFASLTALAFSSLFGAAQTLSEDILKDVRFRSIDPTCQAGLNRTAWDMTVRRELSADEKKAGGEMLRRGRAAGCFDADFEYTPAPAGEYRIVLAAEGREAPCRATIVEEREDF